MVDDLRQGLMNESAVRAEKSAPKGLRMLAAISFDLVYIPFFIGFLAGLVLFNAPDWFRVVILVLLNIAWVVGKDMNGSFLSFGKRLAGIKVVSASTGQAVTFKQAFVRNILLIVPGILFFGYPIEWFFLQFKGQRLGDKWAGTTVVMN
jgi:uncharacterized RDD family membrane protein YckC